MGEARVYRNNNNSASFAVCLRSHFLVPPQQMQRLILLRWDALLPRAQLQSFSLDPKPKAILGARGLRIHWRAGEKRELKTTGMAISHLIPPPSPTLHFSLRGPWGSMKIRIEHLWMPLCINV